MYHAFDPGLFLLFNTHVLVSVAYTPYISDFSIMLPPIFVVSAQKWFKLVTGTLVSSDYVFFVFFRFLGSFFFLLLCHRVKRRNELFVAVLDSFVVLSPRPTFFYIDFKHDVCKRTFPYIVRPSESPC